MDERIRLSPSCAALRHRRRAPACLFLAVLTVVTMQLDTSSSAPFNQTAGNAYRLPSCSFAPTTRGTWNVTVTRADGVDTGSTT